MSSGEPIMASPVPSLLSSSVWEMCDVTRCQHDATLTPPAISHKLRRREVNTSFKAWRAKFHNLHKVFCMLLHFDSLPLLYSKSETHTVQTYGRQIM